MPKVKNSPSTKACISCGTKLSSLEQVNKMTECEKCLLKVQDYDYQSGYDSLSEDRSYIDDLLFN